MADDIVVEFLAFDGCPLAPESFNQLEQAVEQLKGFLKVKINQIDLMCPSTSESLKRWGSPTILLNGLDISGAEQGDANCCRIYPGAGGVLSKQQIVAALMKETQK